MKKISYLPHLLSLTLLTLYGCGSSSSDGGQDNSVPAVTPTNPSTPSTPSNQGMSSDTLLMSDINLLQSGNGVARPSAEAERKIQLILDKTNAYRREKGLPPLKINPSLQAYAAVRARELVTVFEHKRPNGKSALDPSFFKRWRALGENIAEGYRTAEAAATGWRNSEDHYKNMINPLFAEIGIGYYNNRWVQVFGGHDTQTIYAFADSISKQDVRVAIDKHTSYYGKRLSINVPTQSLGDSLASYSSQGVFANPHVIEIGGHQIILRPNEQAGWRYQTIGELSTTDAIPVPEAYVNVGKATTPALGLKAHYQGKAIGDLGQHSRVIADMSADVDFNQSSKQVKVELFNSQIARNDLRNQSVTAFTDGSQLNFSDTLRWNAGKQQFESATGQARLYGDNAEEIGGQFARQVSGEVYRGAYGGKQ